MKLYSYLQAVKCARTDYDWARSVIEELDAGASLPKTSFEPHGRSGSVTDITQIDALRRISRRKYAGKKMRDALATLNEFKAIIRRADLNDLAQAAMWARWGAKLTYKEIGERLGMPTHQACALIHDAESIVQPIVEGL